MKKYILLALFVFIAIGMLSNNSNIKEVQQENDNVVDTIRYDESLTSSDTSTDDSVTSDDSDTTIESGEETDFDVEGTPQKTTTDPLPNPEPFDDRDLR